MGLSILLVAGEHDDFKGLLMTAGYSNPGNYRILNARLLTNERQWTLAIFQGPVGLPWLTQTSLFKIL